MNRTKRILMSLALVGAVAAAVGLGSAAFFSDTETSTGNVLQAGAIDLEIDNHSYYYGPNGWEFREDLSWVLGEPIGLFFNFDDLKPGDAGEDTVSIHVHDNPAWLCTALRVTMNDDVSSTDPELDVDVPEDPENDFDGELAGELQFAFWIDDGDNVWECGEREEQEFTTTVGNNNLGDNCEPVLTYGPASDAVEGLKYALSDDTENSLKEGPTNPNRTYYIGKYWCFGDVAPAPVQQDGNDNVGPDQRGSGFDCDGSNKTNIAQTDRVEGDVLFYAVQARHNEGFSCADWDPFPTEVSTEPYENWPAYQDPFGEKVWEAEGRIGDLPPTSGATTWEVGVGLNTQGATQDNNQSPDTDFDWPDGSDVDFTLTYNAGSGLATFEVDGASTQSYNVNPDGLDGETLWLAVKAGSTDTATVDNLVVNGSSAAGSATSTGGLAQSLQVLGVDPSDGFTLEGTINFDYSGSPSQSDLVFKVEVAD